MAVTNTRVLETGKNRESIYEFNKHETPKYIPEFLYSNPLGGITVDKKARPTVFDFTTTGANGRR